MLTTRGSDSLPVAGRRTEGSTHPRAGEQLGMLQEPRTMLDRIRGRARGPRRLQELLPRGVTSAVGCGTSAVSPKRRRPMRLAALLIVLVAAAPAAGTVDGEPPRRFRPFKGDGTIHECCKISRRLTLPFPRSEPPAADSTRSTRHPVRRFPGARARARERLQRAGGLLDPDIGLRTAR